MHLSCIVSLDQLRDPRPALHEENTDSNQLAIAIHYAADLRSSSLYHSRDLQLDPELTPRPVIAEPLALA